MSVKINDLQRRVNEASGQERIELQEALDIALIDQEMSELRLLVGGTRWGLRVREHKPALNMLRRGMRRCEVVSHYAYKK
ncbi:hypothetical protein D3C81_1955510 [compost metagenome]